MGQQHGVGGIETHTNGVCSEAFGVGNCNGRSM